MASFGSGFASGMGSGMAMGKMLMDTYNEYDQKDKLKKAGELSQEEISAGLTKDQQTTADYVNDANNGYEVEKLDNGALRYRTAGSDNSWTELTPGAKQYKLGDKVQNTAFSADQINRARDDARAKVLMDAGDVKGAYGLRALAREDRKGQQWDDINQNQINDLQALAEGKYENLRGTIDKGVQRYNDAQTGPYADGHKMAIDWDNNQAIVSKGSDVVKKIPITQQTAAQFIRAYYDDLRAAANPEYGLSARKTSAEERKAGASEMSAQADLEYKGRGGVAERVGMMNAAARGDSASKPNVRMTQVNITDDQGVTSKVPVSVVTQVGKNGVPVVQAYSLDGKPINDKRVMSQLAGSDDGGVSTTGRNADLAAARKGFESGNMDYSTYQNTVAQITQTYDRKDTLNALSNDFKTVEKDQGREAAVRSVVAQIEGSVKNPKDREVVYGQLGLKQDEINRVKRGKSGVAAASTYSQQSTWQPGQRRIPENMRGQ